MHTLTLGSTSEIGASLCSIAGFLAAGSSLLTSIEGDANFWELRLWQVTELTAACGFRGEACSSGLRLPFSPEIGKFSLERLSCRLPYSINRDEEGKQTKGWLGSTAGFPFSVLETVEMAGCSTWPFVPFGRERYNMSD